LAREKWRTHFSIVAKCDIFLGKWQEAMNSTNVKEVYMRAEIEHFIDEYIDRFNKLGIHVNALVLFGSQARNTATISSDIDIAVVMDEDLPPRTRGELLCLGDETDMRFDVNLFFTTRDAVENATGDFDTNKYIREEGVVLWQS